MKIGYLPQEPELDDTKNVRGNVLDGVDPARKSVMEDYLEVRTTTVELIIAKLSHKMEEQTAAGSVDPTVKARYDKVKQKAEDMKLQEFGRRIEVAMSALRCPNGDSAVDRLSGVLNS